MGVSHWVLGFLPCWGSTDEGGPGKGALKCGVQDRGLMNHEGMVHTGEQPIFRSPSCLLFAPLWWRFSISFLLWTSHPFGPTFITYLKHPSSFSFSLLPSLKLAFWRYSGCHPESSSGTCSECLFESLFSALVCLMRKSSSLPTSKRKGEGKTQNTIRLIFQDMTMLYALCFQIIIYLLFYRVNMN